MTIYNMKDCPRYPRCNAPICPLDPDWSLRSVYPSEPLCGLMSEYAKEGMEARFASRGLTPMLQQITPVILEITKKHMFIGKKLEYAARSGSKWDSADRLHEEMLGGDDDA